MKSLKLEEEELSKKGFGYYSPQYSSFLFRKNELFSKVSKFIQKLFTEAGCLTQSSYIYVVFNAIYDGLFTFTSYKKNKFSAKEIINMYKK